MFLKCSSLRRLKRWPAISHLHWIYTPGLQMRSGTVPQHVVYKCMSFIYLLLPPPPTEDGEAGMLTPQKERFFKQQVAESKSDQKLKGVLLIFWFSAERCRGHLESSRVFPWEDLSPRHGGYQLSPHQRNSSQLLIRCQNSLPLPPITWHRPWCIARESWLSRLFGEEEVE